MAVAFAKEIEVAKGLAQRAMDRVGAHEQECERRYGEIKDSLKEAAAADTTIDAKLDMMLDKHNTDQWTMNWKAWGVASAIFSIMLGVVVWEGKELYRLSTQPARVAVEAKAG